MIIPCIDLMGGRVVQLVQGREKALEGDSPDRMLKKFEAFPVIQVIDLDAAIGSGSNEPEVEYLATRARTRVGGGVRSPEKAKRLLDLGVERVIVGTAAFTSKGPDREFLDHLAAAVPKERVLLALDSKDGQIVVKGWRESLEVTAEEIIHDLEPYCGGFLCTYVDKEGMMQGTDLDWFRRLRSATSHEITAAGGITTIEDIRALDDIGVHAALGMAIYTGRLDLAELAVMKQNTPPPTSMSGGLDENRGSEGTTR
jgi:phosphoribosylformimino-5-aminoimidazole carboxamide ribotide isomerase